MSKPPHYVVIENGVARNYSPDVEVFDLDVLRVDGPVASQEQVEEVMDLQARADRHEIEDVEAQCATWLDVYAPLRLFKVTATAVVEARTASDAMDRAAETSKDWDAVEVKS